MDDARPGGQPPRPRPTPAERRQQRAEVDDPAEVLDAAARFLEARPRSVAEVRRRLAGLGYQAVLVAAAVERLTALGYLDDAAFAEAWVASRDRSMPRGERALRFELSRKGIDRSIVDGVLAARRDQAAAAVPDGAAADGARAGAGDAVPGADEAAAARLLEKRLPAILRQPDPRRRQQQAYALLARSGFSPDVCGTVTRRVLGAAAAVSEGDEDWPER